MEQMVRGFAGFEVARGAICIQQMVRGTAAGEQQWWVALSAVLAGCACKRVLQMEGSP